MLRRPTNPKSLITYISVSGLVRRRESRRSELYRKALL
nr:MAG TPA_asm: hypothetical protein [Caudoviricetes sp.]